MSDVILPAEIEVETLAQWRTDGRPVTMVDVRERWEWDLCHIDGANHVPLSELPERVDDLPTDHPIVMVCHIGGRSGRATQWLRSHGFPNVTNLAGGVEAWALTVDPTMARY